LPQLVESVEAGEAGADDHGIDGFGQQVSGGGHESRR
jgi:hypothetical protein